MKHLFTILLLIGCALGANAELLLQEDFDYPIGDELTEHGWYTQWGVASGMTITNGLELAPYIGSGVGNAALIDCESSGNQAHIAFKETTSGNVYAAFLFQPSINHKRGYFFALRDKNTEQGSYIFNQNARVLLEADGRIGLAFANNQKAVFTDEASDPQKVYLIVVKYSIIAGENNDEVSLYVLDGYTGTEPATPTIGALTDADEADIYPANVQLRGYDSNGWLVVDGLRVATTWEEAVASSGTTGTDNAASFDETVEVYSILGTYMGRFENAAAVNVPTGMYIYKTQRGTEKVVR